MANLQGTERELFVNNTFNQIASRYVFMNHLMTGGMDILLRKEAIRIANLKDGEQVLDLGTGTGDLAKEARRKKDSLQLFAADFTLAMMTATQNWAGISRTGADALQLPFGDASFDIVMSGYLVRNVSDLEKTLSEQFRVLKPGGRVIILDMTRPRHNLLTPIINVYFKKVIPILGQIFNRNREAYTYLIESTQHFVRAEDLVKALQNSGFSDVRFHIRMFGTMAIHTATKPN